ncbi:MAG: NADH:ubiquinone reductase (Na(+)-transporting) subunit C [Flavobacteriaceae bacterium]|nr:NADH:ubiquinone reductase (Na(+)-transporting) subunit C [Flavobacteriaceae bacterium]|tara:strand:+ start:11012 stop:11743 length:732 start_codon:yes stop_codon:yes gene_type:complete
MNRDSNAYTFLFSAIMVVVVAATLATTSTLLKDIQAENVRKEKMQNILATIGVEVDREEAEQVYNKYILEELSLKSDGSIDKNIDAFKLNLSVEIKKPREKQRFPIYLAEVDSSTYYIVPLRGSGLWDAIWGYVALEGDKNTIKGAVFDHKGETAGLGAEITQNWFQNSFKGEKVLDKQGKLVGVNVSKTNNDPKGRDKNDNEVDAISGATITGDGVTEMIKERLQNYLPYFNSQEQKIAYTD